MTTLNLIDMAKMTKAELASTWAKNNNVGGDNPYWDRNNTYYNLTVDQILKMAKYIETKRIAANSKI